MGPSARDKLRFLKWKVFKQGYLIGIDTPVEVARKPVEKILDSVGCKGFITGHVGYTGDILDSVFSKGFKPIVMVRDPRAVLCSFVNYVVSSDRHHLHRYFVSLGVEDQYRVALNGADIGNGIYLQPLKVRCMALYPWIENKHVECFQFEDLVGEKGGGTASNQMASLKRIQALLEIQDVNALDVSHNLFGPGRSTFRKGQVGTWREEIPYNIRSEINEDMNTILNTWGYEI